MRVVGMLVTAVVFLSSTTVRAGTDVWTPTGPPGAFVRAVVVGPDGSALIGTSVGVYSNVSVGGTSWELRVRLAGGCTALALDPTQPSTVYAGAGNQTLYRSLDRGLTWEIASQTLNGEIIAIAVDPQQPQRIVLATDGNCAQSTDDGGATWTQRCSGLPARVRALAMDATNPSRLYAVATAGIFRSTDHGVTWTTALGGLDSVIATGAVAIDPHNPATVYASYSGSFGGGNLFKSTDGGDTWTQLINDGIPAHALAVDPDDSSIYLGTLGGVSKSTDGGVTWAVSLPGNGVMDLVVSPADHAVVYAGATAGVRRTSDRGATWINADGGLGEIGIVALAVNAASDTLLASLWCSTVFDSTDGGAHWSPANLPFPTWSFATDPQAPLTVYAGVSPTVTKSTDGGHTWTWLGDFPRASISDESVQQVMKVAVDPSTTPSTVWAGTGFQGLWRSSDGGATWSRFALMDKTVTDIAFDPQTPGTMWVTTTNESGGRDGAINKSTDGGLTWTSWQPIDQYQPDIFSRLPVYRFYSVAIDPQTPSTVYVGADTGVFRTRDGGATWEQVGIHMIYAFGLAVDPVVPSTLYAGTHIGMFRSEDGGDHWLLVDAGLSDNEITTVTLDPHDHQHLFAGTVKGGLFEREFVRGGADPVPAAPIDDLVLTIGGLGTGKESIGARGTIRFGSQLPVPPLAVDSVGMHVRIEDTGNGDVAVLDVTIPGGATGSPDHCGPLDGWKRDVMGTTQTYTNKTTEMSPPTCALASARGIVKAKAKDATSHGKGAKFIVNGKKGKYGPVTGPFRVTVVLGGESQAAGGQAGQQTFQVSQCVRTGTTIRCR